MHAVIYAIDKPGAGAIRLQRYDDHKGYLAAAKVTIVISGPLLADDGQTMIGSLFLLEVDDMAQATAFNRADPFYSAGLWHQVEVRPFLKRMDNRPEPS